jgi:hypothetical protein
VWTLIFHQAKSPRTHEVSKGAWIDLLLGLGRVCKRWKVLTDHLIALNYPKCLECLHPASALLITHKQTPITSFTETEHTKPIIKEVLQLPTLTSLSLISPPDLPTIQQKLPCWNQITEFKCRSLPIRLSEHLTNITKLKLTECNVLALLPLIQLHSLTTENVKNIQHITKFTNIQKLHVETSLSEDPSFLTQLTSLTSLTFHLSFLSPFRTTQLYLTNLTKLLYIHHTNLLVHPDILSDTLVSLHDNSFEDKIMNLHQFTNLTSLTFYPPILDPSTTLSPLTNLVSLSFSNPGPEVSLPPLPKLQKLEFLDNIQKIQFSQPASKLCKIHFNQFVVRELIEVLPPNLLSLKCWSASDSLTMLTNLTNLTVEDGDQEHMLAWLSGLPKLKILKMATPMKEEEVYKFLPNLEKFTSF